MRTNFMKQSHGLPELPKRRFTLCDASHLSGVESWADSPRKSHKKPLDHHPERLKAGRGNTKPAHLMIEMSNLPLTVFFVSDFGGSAHPEFAGTLLLHPNV
jgi:hypothetical protein